MANRTTEEWSKLRHDAFRYIQCHLETEGYPPTVRQMQTVLGIKSLATVQKIMRWLEATGRLEVKRNGAHVRSMRIVPERKETEDESND